MAINFPTNPTNGQTFLALGRGWQYNSTSGSWEALIRVNTAFDSDDIVQGTTQLVCIKMKPLMIELVDLYKLVIILPKL